MSGPEERESRRAEREARREARREERRGRRIEMRGEGLHLKGLDIDGMRFGDFAKGFMKDFVTDASGETYSETVTKEFSFQGMPRLRVRNISGATVIRTGEAGKIRVVAKKQVSAGSEDRAKRLLQNLEIRLEQHGDELRVEPHLYEQERGWVDLFRGKRFRVDFEIAVPQECGIDAHTVSGELSLAGMRGPLEVQTVSGEIAIEDVQGPLRLKSVSGDVDCRRYVGHVDGNTVSGDVTFDAVRLRSVRLHTVSGDVELAGVLEPSREHRFRTISGDVELCLSDPDLTLEFRTASGDLECEAPARVTRQSRKECTVVLGEGSGQATVKTVSGDLTVEGAAVSVPGEPATERASAERTDAEASFEAETEALGGPAAETQPLERQTPPSEEIRSVLDRLARGELGVDDAAAALDAARRAR